MAELKADRSGFVSKCDARIIGEVIRDLGGGRLKMDSVINHDVGVDRIAKPGDRVDKNSVLARIHAANPSQAKIATERLLAALKISRKPVDKIPLVAQIIK